MSLRKQNGFSLLELMITVSLILILGGVTFVAMQPMVNQGHVDSAYDTTLMAMRNTRNLAITQSHEYILTFTQTATAGTIQVQYQGPASPPGGTLPAPLPVITYSIPNDVQFNVQTGFPSSAPDGWGTGVVAIDFQQQIAGGTPSVVVFMPDGSAQDVLGNYNNGVLYLTRPGNSILNSRAISLMGATGRVRGWRLGQTGATYHWVQQ